MPPDHYAAAERLAEELRVHGHEEWATALRDAIATGCTSTEILMALRTVLARIVTGEGVPEHLRQEAQRQQRLVASTLR